MLDVFLYTLKGVVPIFLVIFVGILLNRLHFFSETTKSDMIRLVFYVGTPCLIFRQISTADLHSVVSPKFLVFLVLAILAEILLMWALCFFIRDPKKKGAVLQLSYRSNFAIIGMPLAESLLSAEGVAMTAVALSFTIIVYNVTAVILLSYYGGSERKLKPVLLGIVKNPLIIAVVLGLIASLIKLPMGTGSIQYKTLQTLGTIASSMGLLVIGASVTLRGLREDRFYIFYSVFLRCIVAPAFILGSAILLGFRGDALSVLAIMSATPSAVNCFVMAKKMGVSGNISAFGISFSSLFSLFSVFASIFILKIAGVA